MTYTMITQYLNWRRTMLALGTLVAILALAPIIQLGQGAWAGNPLNPYKKLNDRFDVYDFTSRDASRSNVDWPVTFIFMHNAFIDKVKNAMNGAFPVGYRYGLGASKMQFLLENNGHGWEWDQDGGKKTSMCEGPGSPNVLHYRVYAPYPADHFYNQDWGNYIVGTSHIDHNECFPTGDYWAGHSEQAENQIAGWTAYYFGADHSTPDAIWLGNQEPYREQGSHIWENNGYAARVWVR